MDVPKGANSGGLLGTIAGATGALALVLGVGVLSLAGSIRSAEEASAAPQSGCPAAECPQQSGTPPQSGEEEQSGGAARSGGDEVPSGTSPENPGHASGQDGERAPEDGNVVHIVADGDTLSSLSAQYGVSVEQLAFYNGITDVNLIYTDSALRVPYLEIPRIDPETGEIVVPEE